VKPKELVERVQAGETAAIARMLTRVERGADGVHDQIAELYRAGGDTHVIGVTGAPGSGKSTLVAALAQAYRRRKATLGVVAVDPSSPYSGGSILGDRIRMHELGDDPGVFVRSMATRGALGGLARATVDAVTVLAAAGKDVVLIETVGVGQDEVEIAQASHSTLVVSVPGLGDEIQALKAGVLEIADVHVVNKSDRPGADKVVAELRDALRLSRRQTGWRVPVQAVSAERGTGVDDLVDVLDRHRGWLVESGALELRERDMAAARVRSILQDLVMTQVHDPTTDADLAATVEEVRARKIDPYHAARDLLRAASQGVDPTQEAL
jgi:LAO/AO transport system kinase